MRPRGAPGLRVEGGERRPARGLAHRARAAAAPGGAARAGRAAALLHAGAGESKHLRCRAQRYNNYIYGYKHTI